MFSKAIIEIKKNKAENLKKEGRLLINRVEQYIVSKNKLNFEIFKSFCKTSKSLYNSINYICKNKHNSGEYIPSYFDFEKQSKQETKDLEHLNYHYRKLPSQSSQQVIKEVTTDWKNYFAAKAAFAKDPSKFKGMPKPPGYKKITNLITVPQNFSIKKNKLHFLHKSVKPITLSGKYNAKDIKQIKIIPEATCFRVIVIYEIELKILEKVESKRILGIDLGVNNLTTCANNVGLKPFVINGRQIKSINQFYNKVKAQMQRILPSYLDKNNNKRERKWSKALATFSLRRQQTLNDVLHKQARFIIDYCKHHLINTIVAGYNPYWKQNINLGKRTNQNFTYIPHRKFLNILKYMAEDASIFFIENEESYTSKCSFLDNEEIVKHEEYLGKRIKRGLFRSSKGILINADVNGALNIIRKVFPNAFDVFEGRWNRGCGLHPIKLSGLFELSFKPKIYDSKLNLLKSIDKFE